MASFSPVPPLCTTASSMAFMVAATSGGSTRRLSTAVVDSTRPCSSRMRRVTWGRTQSPPLAMAA